MSAFLPSVRRAVLLVAATMLVACGSDPASPEPDAPIARWVGSYTSAARFGDTNGTWGNGGSFPLVVFSGGEVTIGGVPLQDVSYDAATATLSWTRAAGNSTNGEVTFRESLTSDFFFADRTDDTAGQNFTGWIQRAGEGRLDYRGVLQSAP